MGQNDLLLPSENKLRLMVFKNCLELGQKVNEHLLKMYNMDPNHETFIIKAREEWFQDGHQKVMLDDTVRKKDVYFLTDIGNYSQTYPYHGFVNHISPNDYVQQLKDGIGACKSHTNTTSILMPLLFAGRQHRRKGREPLSCATFLREVDDDRNIDRLITFDAHDPGVEQAVRYTEFDNFFVSNYILKEFINAASKEELENIMFVSPDNGATSRANFYLNSFNCDAIKKYFGSFYKERDYNRVVDGKNPVISHEYMGKDDVTGMTAMVIDDMISSGGSMFDVIDGLNERGIGKVYLVVTYALFTNGIERFKKYYEEGKLAGVYMSNLSYVPEEFKKEPWLHVVDCSEYVAKIIYHFQNDMSISELLNDKSYPGQLLELKFKGQKHE